MQSSRALISLGVSTLLIGLALPGTVYCQDKPAADVVAPTLLSRLKDVKFVGMSQDQRDRSLVLTAMTDEQHTAFAEATAKARAFFTERNTKRKIVQDKINEARIRNESPVEIAKLQVELEQTDPHVTTYGYQSFGSDAYRVVHVGLDYLEIEDPRWPDKTELIPQSEIRKVIFRKDVPKFEVRHEGRVAPAPPTP